MAKLSFLECVKAWEQHRSLRKRARGRNVLLLDIKGRKHVVPSLENTKLNASIIRPMTREMAKSGRIRKPINLIKEVVRKFYENEANSDDENQLTTDAKLRKDRNINKSAEIIKSMLTMIKRKWAKWELPRDEDIRAMVLDMAEAMSKAYSEGRCALEKSPKQPGSGATDEDVDSDDMADDESLRASLHRSVSRGGQSSASSDRLSVPSPLEACLKAPPQAEMERLLGISLNPESYEWLRRGGQKPASQPVAPGAPVDEGALALPVGAPEAAEAAFPPIHSQVLADFVDDSQNIEGIDAHESPKKAVPDPLSPGSPEFISYKPAAARVTPPSTSSGLARQLAGMDPAKLRDILAVVNKKLNQASSKDHLILDKDIKRKLNFEDASEAGSTSAGSGSSVDNTETQAWDVGPEDYVNSWLESQRAEDAAKVQAALAREKELKARAEHEAVARRLQAELEECEPRLGKPAAFHDWQCSVI
ncbi:unnamed protein product [Symbiodinium sp. CCMP2592]|nr:unnamed protein product [Symbiodinium sp. CCMP2592]